MRILYDLSTQPFSVGDVLIFQQTALCLTDEVEFVVKRGLVNDPKLRHITEKDYEWLMPVTRVNQRLKSSGFGDEGDWPPPNSPYMFYRCLEIINKHRPEPLKPSLEMQAWAKEYLGGRTTVQLRRNPFNPERNSIYSEWMRFFKRRPERFLVVCAPDEAEYFPNVEIFATTDTEKVCALIEAAPIHLGASSGPAQMRIYSQKPFAIFGDRMKPNRIPCLRQVGNRFYFPWTNEKQFIFTSTETTESIEAAFDEINSGAGKII